jgi:LCP family protein required for cell wall assembly
MGLPKKRKKNRNKKIAWILAVIFICVIIFVGGLAYISVRKEKNLSTDSSVSGFTSSTSRNTVTYQDKQYTYNDHLSNFVFMGVDNRETSGTKAGMADAGQADAIFLMSWDRVEHSIKIISIPRDTMTEIELFSVTGKSLGKVTDHINLAYGVGDGKNQSCELVRDAVSNLLYDIPIQGYCSINLDGIPILTEVVGGVTVTVPDDSLEEKYPEFQEGAQVVLTEDNVEAFVRYRDIEISQSALVRQQRQSVFLKAFAERASEIFATDPSVVTRLYTELSEYMVTNIGNDIFLKIAEDVADGGESETMTIPGEGVEGEEHDEYYADEDALYDMVIQNFYKES